MNRQSHHELLLNGATELGLSLTELQKEKLLTYVHYIEKWNRVYNLTAITSTEGIINKHILDALTLIGRIDLKQKNSWGVKRRLWCHLISLDSLFQKTLVMTKKK